MTGQLVLTEGKKRTVGGHPTADWVNKLPSKHTRVVMGFKDGLKLFFNDMRTFGWMKIGDVPKLPPDVVDEEFDFNYLKSVLRGSKRAVKLVILDQKKMGGIGNIYANDGLFLAGVDPRKLAGELNEKEIKKLWKAVRKVINKGVVLGGATYSDYKDTRGQGGKYQEHFLVYGREGKVCKRCGEKIKKFKLRGRGTYWCERCQK
jgi:formamidopyrimidine-DNA glycosylase